MANIINVLVLIVTYMFEVWCHMHEDSGMKNKGTGNHMNMTGGNNGTEGTHGTGGTHGGTMKVKLIKTYSESCQTSKIEFFVKKCSI